MSFLICINRGLTKAKRYHVLDYMLISPTTRESRVVREISIYIRNIIFPLIIKMRKKEEEWWSNNKIIYTHIEL